MSTRRRSRILIAHVDSAVAFLLAETLVDMGYGVEVGAGKRLPDLVEACATVPPVLGRPDLIVADDSVLSDEPVTVLQCLRLLANVPPFLILAPSRRASMVELSRHGGHAILRKPFLLDEFAEVVSKMIRHALS